MELRCDFCREKLTQAHLVDGRWRYCEEECRHQHEAQAMRELDARDERRGNHDYGRGR